MRNRELSRIKGAAKRERERLNLGERESEREWKGANVKERTIVKEKNEKKRCR